MSAIVHGEILAALPADLYIPPDALEVVLESFAGPLDLLLYLIRRDNIDILDIPITEVTRQYMVYVEVMKTIKLELAAEYLVMAATLAEIKSRMLLPRSAADSPEEADPRAELVRRLLEYEQYRTAVDVLEAWPRLERDLFVPMLAVTGRVCEPPRPEVPLTELLDALRTALVRAEAFAHHRILREPLSVRERMTRILDALRTDGFTEFASLFHQDEGRPGVVVTFLAVLELVRGSLIVLVQNEPFAPIHVRVPA